MKKLIPLLLICLSARAENVLVVTNDLIYGTYPSLVGQEGTTRLTIFVQRRGAAVSQSGIVSEIIATDLRDYDNVVTVPGRTADPANGSVRFDLTEMQAGQYRIVGQQYATGNPSAKYMFANNLLTLTNAMPDVYIDYSSITNIYTTNFYYNASVMATDDVMQVTKTGTNFYVNATNAFKKTGDILFGNINLNGQTISNGFLVGDGSGITNLTNINGYAVVGPLTHDSADLDMTWDGSIWTNASGYSSDGTNDTELGGWVLDPDEYIQTPLLADGYHSADIGFQTGGAFNYLRESYSRDGTTFEADPAAYDPFDGLPTIVRFFTPDLPPIGTNFYAIVTNLVINSYEYPANAILTNDFLGVELRIRDSDESESPVRQDEFDAADAAIWEAVTNTYAPGVVGIDLEGNVLTFGSYWDSQQIADALVFSFAGNPVFTLSNGGTVIVSVASFSFDGSDIDLRVVCSTLLEPTPQWSTNMTDWTSYSTNEFTSTWPNLTNGIALLEFAAHTGETAAVYYRAVAIGTNAGPGSASLTVDLAVNGTVTAYGFIGDGSSLTNLTETDPVWESEKAAYATGTPLYVFTETDLIALADISNRFEAGYTVPAWNGAAITGLTASGGTDTGAVQKVGDTMTGPLTINPTSTNALKISTAHTNIEIGAGAITDFGDFGSIAIGYYANAGLLGSAGENIAIGRETQGTRNGIAIGNYAYAYLNSVAIGQSANGNNAGAVVGNMANGATSGAALGNNANGGAAGVALGAGANGNTLGVSVGRDSNGSVYGVAVGYTANGARTNIAIGVGAVSSAGSERIAMGHNVSNAVDNSAAIRGSLYLDGGTGVAVRATFGAGAWTWFQTDGTNLFFVNSTGGTEQVTGL